MAIIHQKDSDTFLLSSADMTYALRIVDGIPLHLHWGAPVRTIQEDPLARLSIYTRDNFTLHELPLDRLPQECPVFGTADFREGVLTVRHPDGTCGLDLRLQDWKILPSVLSPEGMPGACGEAETLVLTLSDALSGLQADLIYTLFEDCGILCRRLRLKNTGKFPLTIERALSFALDMEGSDLSLLTLAGSWARERDLVLRPLTPGETGISSLRGASSHQTSPFMALLSPDASETQGEVYGMALAYSGSFLGRVLVDQDHNTRVMMGISPEGFAWTLQPGQSFDTPEAYLCYSNAGLETMSLRFHDFISRHIVRGPFAHAPRPLLINNWEATYFDFDEEKILSLARTAKAAGIDLFVLDDGWFGHRDADTSSLGDWFDHPTKLPHGLAGLSEQIHQMGLLFGLWVEPEMISPDSDLYRAHPDWCIHSGSRERLESRHQLVLDLTRLDVRDYIVAVISDALRRGNVDYVKWDMNRNITLAGSALLPPEQMREFYHRYILGLYDLLERITTAFPHVLFESCAGGGGRFDLGMMAYMPQAWTSDNTDAWQRCRIQHSTSLLFPPSCMGAHVSAVPNHQTGRVTPLTTRMAVAMGGTYGYELDLNRLSSEELASIRHQNERMHDWQQVFLYGHYYRLLSPFSDSACAFMSVSQDGTRAAVTYVSSLNVANTRPRLLRLRGLDPEESYQIEGWERVYGGDELMHRGLPLAQSTGDFAAQQFFLHRI